MRQRLKILSLLGLMLSLTLGLTACPSRSAVKTSPTETTYFVHGDPQSLIAGATLNKISPITTDNAKDWEKFGVITLSAFKERGIKPKTTNSLEENAPQKKLVKSTVVDDSVEIFQVEGQWHMRLMGGKIIFKMEVQDDGRLQPVTVTTATESEEGHNGSSTPEAIAVLNWSVSQDATHMSLLLNTKDDEGGKVLVAIYFERRSAEPAVQIPQGGPGQLIGWKLPDAGLNGAAVDSALEIQFCGSDPEFALATQEGVEKWNVALEGRLPLHYSQTLSYGPFSDLNQHCVYAVNAFIEDGRSDVIILGSTSEVLTLTGGEIFDADVFMYREEINKYYHLADEENIPKGFIKPGVDKNIKLAATHELGHLLGLAHKFDGTPSIMSYDFTETKPSAYDISAIQKLYPMRVPKR